MTNPADVVTTSGTYTWDNAVKVCQGLVYAGYGTASTSDADPTGWRLPNVKELLSIVDWGVGAAPRINKPYFWNTKSNFYWSSTTDQPALGAWVVGFSIGDLPATAKTAAQYVRCVRGP
jgi:hypothetical protein